MHGSFHQFWIWTLEVPVTLAPATDVIEISLLPAGPIYRGEAWTGHL